MVERFRNHPIKAYSYYNTGGISEYFYLPRNLEELCECMREIHALEIPWFFLGAGSNSLVSDATWPGAVISFAKMTALYRAKDSNLVYAQAGVINSNFSEFCVENSLNGAGWMNRLPGMLGATVRMNARCYGGEISQIVSRVTTVDHQGDVHIYDDMSRIFRGYKDTVFMERPQEAIAEIEFKLTQGDTTETCKLMQYCKEDRERKNQFEYPSCGCVFKNRYDVGIPSGKLLESSGVKEWKLDKMKINRMHANFLFNCGATSEEIYQTTLRMREAVFRTHRVWLPYEMEFLGAWGWESR